MFAQNPWHKAPLRRSALRTPGHERLIAASTHRGARFVEVSLLIDGNERGGLRINDQAAPIVARALELARASTVDRKLGTFSDGKFDVNVSTRPHPAGCVAVFLQTVDANGYAAGRAVTLYGDDFDAVDRGLAWLVQAS